MKLKITLVVLLAGICNFPYALADEVNPQIANCQEITDQDTQTQVDLCTAHVGCKLVMGIHKACTKVKSFLNNLKNLTFGENKDNKIDSSDVFDAAAPSVGNDDSFSKASISIKNSYDKAPKKQITSGEFEDGSKWVYEGPMVKGERNGTGVLITEGGTMFRGDFVKSKQKGKGEMFNDETHKVGDMAGAKMNGNGIEIKSNGLRYEGGYKDNNYHGKGMLTTASGSKLEGMFKDGKANGQGTYTFKDGGTYVGEFVEGNFEGRGKAKFADGNQYEGEWKVDKKHGRGTFTWKDGSRYEGEWQDNKKLNGIETAANGSKIEIANGVVVKTPQQIAAGVAEKYDQQINAASEECNTSKESCDTKCASLALLVVLSKSGDTQAHLQCTNECDSEKSQCDQQVNTLQQEKKKAIAVATAPRVQQAQAPQQQVAKSGVATQAPSYGSGIAAKNCSAIIERAMSLGDEFQALMKSQHSYRQQIKEEARNFLDHELPCSAQARDIAREGIARNENYIRTQQNGLDREYAIARSQMAICLVRERLAECDSAKQVPSNADARGLPVEECHRQAKASNLSDKLNKLPRNDSVLLARGAIVNLDFLIRTYSQCLPDQYAKKVIDEWRVQREQTLRVCRQTSSSDNCLHSPY